MNTIAAISTAYGTGAIAVVRVSGDDAIKIAQKVFKSYDGTTLQEMDGYTSKVGQVFYNGEPIDEVVTTVFKAPKSYNGEDIVQISCHGGMYITKLVLRSLLDAGASMAGRGEFTRRAFLNGKISLEKAESIMGLISSSYEVERKINFSTYCGALRNKIAEIKNILIDLLSSINAEIDYPDEDIPKLSNDEIVSKIDKSIFEIDKLVKSYSAGYIIQNGIRTAIIGSPNVGKSTLMNLLSNREKSIVTDIAGTTRDAIEEKVILGNVPLVLVDTAGIRETEDKIEQIGARKSREIAETANLILLLLDSSREISNEEFELIHSFDSKKVIIIVNKIDINPNFDSSKIENNKIVYMSAKNSQGLDDLSKEIEKFVDFGSDEGDELIITTERQRDVLVKSLSSLNSIKSEIGKIQIDALAEYLKEPLNILSEFSGEQVEDQIVDDLFSKFCVGK